MTEAFKPTSLDELRDAIAWALANEARLEVVAQGTKRGIGRPDRKSTRLNSSH